MSKTSSALNGIEYCCICHRSYPVGATHSCYELGSSGQTEQEFKTKPSDIELRIRKDVTVLIDKLYHAYEFEEREALIDTIKDRLNLLWGV